MFTQDRERSGAEMVITKFEKCGCQEIVSENVKAEIRETQVRGSEKGFLVEG